MKNALKLGVQLKVLLVEHVDANVAVFRARGKPGAVGVQRQRVDGAKVAAHRPKLVAKHHAGVASSAARARKGATH